MCGKNPAVYYDYLSVLLPPSKYNAAPKPQNNDSANHATLLQEGLIVPSGKTHSKISLMMIYITEKISCHLAGDRAKFFHWVSLLLFSLMKKKKKKKGQALKLKYLGILGS